VLELVVGEAAGVRPRPIAPTTTTAPHEEHSKWSQGPLSVLQASTIGFASSGGVFWISQR
jgi:hypothetical protein